MGHRLPPLIDICELKGDVLTGEPSAALPCNLSDIWLELVAESLDEVLERTGPQSGKYLAGPLALVLHILSGKMESEQIEVEESRLLDYLSEYRLEVALEKVNRRTNVRIGSATLETIFTNRAVTMENPVM